MEFEQVLKELLEQGKKNGIVFLQDHPPSLKQAIDQRLIHQFLQYHSMKLVPLHQNHQILNIKQEEVTLWNLNRY